MKKRTIPFGYEIKNGIIKPEARSAEVVKSIYADYLNGKSFGSIAEELTMRQIDYFCGKTKWDKLMVKRVLE